MYLKFFDGLSDPKLTSVELESKYQSMLCALTMNGYFLLLVLSCFFFLLLPFLVKSLKLIMLIMRMVFSSLLAHELLDSDKLFRCIDLNHLLDLHSGGHTNAS